MVVILVAQRGLMVVKGGPEYLLDTLAEEGRCGMNFSCVVFVNGC